MLSHHTLLQLFTPLFRVSVNPPNVTNPVEREVWEETMRHLSHLPEEHLAETVKYMLRTRQSPYFPRLAEINAASQIVHANRFPSVSEAWAELERFIRLNAHGAEYNPPPVTKRAIEIVGGLWAIRQSYRARQQFELAYSKALLEDYLAL